MSINHCLDTQYGTPGQPSKMECGCPSGRGIQTGHRHNLPPRKPGTEEDQEQICKWTALLSELSQGIQVSTHRVRSRGKMSTHLTGQQHRRSRHQGHGTLDSPSVPDTEVRNLIHHWNWTCRLTLHFKFYHSYCYCKCNCKALVTKQSWNVEEES